MNSKILQVMAMYALAATSVGKDSPTRINSTKISGERYKIIPKGCKEYNCNGFLIIAISQKSAWKKYAKLRKNGRSGRNSGSPLVS